MSRGKFRGQFETRNQSGTKPPVRRGKMSVQSPSPHDVWGPYVRWATLRRAPGHAGALPGGHAPQQRTGRRAPDEGHGKPAQGHRGTRKRGQRRAGGYQDGLDRSALHFDRRLRGVSARHSFDGLACDAGSRVPLQERRFCAANGHQRKMRHGGKGGLPVPVARLPCLRPRMALLCTSGLSCWWWWGGGGGCHHG